jgi:DNA-directed RNA polymerase subunit RPC12/RpoP
MRDLEKGRKVVFEECTPEIVSQINMIPNFKGTADVQSIYGSYTCPNCGHQQNHLFAKGKNLPQSASDSAEEVKCAKCSNKTELDELEEEFFAWIDAG